MADKILLAISQPGGRILKAYIIVDQHRNKAYGVKKKKT